MTEVWSVTSNMTVNDVRVTITVESLSAEGSDQSPLAIMELVSQVSHGVEGMITGV